MDLLETVGARMVLIGQKEYLTGVSSIRDAHARLTAEVKAGVAPTEAMTAATVANQAAQDDLSVAMNAAVAAQREYVAALAASAEADAAAAASTDEVIIARQREATAALESADAQRAAALSQVASSQEAAAAATTGAAEVEVAEGRKAAAAEMSSGAMKTAAFGLVAVAAVVVGASVKMAGDFQQSTERLVTSAGEAQSNLDMVRQGILSMAGQVGYSADDLSAALYKVESGGQHGAAGLQVLQAAAEGAKTENADLTVVSDALTSALTDYHLPASAAADVTSKLVAATSAGKMTFEELAGSMSAILPVASANHVSLNDVLGDLASMTLHGMSAQQASQNLANSIRALSAPNSVAQKEFALLGLTTQQVSASLGKNGLSATVNMVGDAIKKNMGADAQTVILNLQSALKGLDPQVQALGQQLVTGAITQADYTKAAKGLAPELAGQATSFASLAKTTHNIGGAQVSGSQVMQTYTQALSKAMGGATGLNVALMIGGENAGNTAKAIDAVSTATSQADGHVRGWDEIQGTFNTKLSQAKDSLGAVAIQIGTVLLPPLTTLVGWIASGASWLAAHKDAAVAIGIVLGGILVTGLVLATVAAWNFAAALLVVDGALSPIVVPALIVIAVLAGIGLIVYEIIDHWKGIAGFFVGIWNAIKSAAGAAWDWIKGAANDVWSFLKMVGASIAAPFVTAWNWVKSSAETAWNWVLGIVRSVVGAIIKFFQPLVDAVKSHMDEIRMVWNVVWGMITSATRVAMSVVSGIISVAWAIIKGIFTVAAAIIVPIATGIWIAISTSAKVVWALISGVIGTAWAWIKGTVMTAIAVVQTVLDVAWGVIKTVVKVTWDTIVTIFKVAWDIIKGVFTIARDIIIGIINVFLDIITGNWSRAWTDIKDFLSTIWNDIKTTVMSVASDIWHGVESIFTDLWNGLKGIFTGLWADIKHVWAVGANAVIGVVNGFLGVVNKVAGALGFNINLHIDPVPEMAEGGVIPVRLMATGGNLTDVFSQVGDGFKTSGPRAIVGEGNQLYPEYVVPTDPAYRRRALGLASNLLEDLGVGGLGDMGAVGSVDGGISEFARGGSLPVRGGDGVALLAAGGSLGGNQPPGTVINGAAAAGASAQTLGSATGESTSFWDDIVGMFEHGAKWLLDKIWPALPVDPSSFLSFVPGTINGLRDKVASWFDKENTSAGAGAGGAVGGGPGAALAFAHSQVGKPYVWGAAGPDGYDCTGFMSAITNVLRGKNPYSRVGSTGSAPWPGFQDGAVSPIFTVGYSRNTGDGYGHAAGTLLGQSVESAGGVGVRMNGLNAFSSLFPNHMAFRMAEGGVIPTVAGALAGGGDVSGGSKYLVGERGPEIFIPDTDGLIAKGRDDDDPPTGPTGGGGPGGVTVVIERGAVVIYESNDPKASYEAMKKGVSDAVARS